MTESHIERIVELRTDAIDRRYMAGEIDKAEYDEAMDALTDWAERQYLTAKEG